MIVITGATNSIGRCLIQRLNAENFNAIAAIDRFGRQADGASLDGLSIWEKIAYTDGIRWLESAQSLVEFVFHMHTYPPHSPPLKELAPKYDDELRYTQALWKTCVSYQLPLIYLSSERVYGDGAEDFNEDIPPRQLNPTDRLGMFHLNIDRWALEQEQAPFYWAGLRLFGVPVQAGTHISPATPPAGPAEAKEVALRASAPSHSDRPKQGFIAVNDVAEVSCFFMHLRRQAGLYNVGAGDTPIDKLRRVGYTKPFLAL